MYEKITTCIGPICTIFTVEIYNNSDVLITKATAYTKEKARRKALINLENIRNDNAEIVPVSYNSGCKLDSV
jgi:hypothetical protein